MTNQIIPSLTARRKAIEEAIEQLDHDIAELQSERKVLEARINEIENINAILNNHQQPAESVEPKQWCAVEQHRPQRKMAELVLRAIKDSPGMGHRDYATAIAEITGKRTLPDAVENALIRLERAGKVHRINGGWHIPIGDDEPITEPQRVPFEQEDAAAK